MNGEIYQICCIVASAKRALKEGMNVSYTPSKYANKIEFQFLQKKLLNIKNIRADNVVDWFDFSLKRGLEDVKLIMPVEVKDRNILGFSNTTQSSIVCFFSNGKVSYFTARWEFDSMYNAWNILYTEHEWKNAPKGKPRFENNTASFKSVLEDIKKLAYTIECDNFAELFKEAAAILDGGDINTDETNFQKLQLPKVNSYIFRAVSTADVFGAMGSWNDCPPYMAHEKGLDKEYDALSSELLKQIRLATLYAINEW